MLIRHKLLAGGASLLAAALLVLFVVIQYFATPIIRQQSIANAEHQAQITGETIARELAKTETLTKNLAALAEILPLEPADFSSQIGQLIRNADGIAGGGIWPEPHQLIPGQQRASLFWAKNTQGQFSQLDDYNQPTGSGYHQESWYRAAKTTPLNQCAWSAVYADPVSNIPMVTCSVPIQRQGQFWGVATIDLELSGLDDLLLQENRASQAFNFIVDQTQQMVSLPALRQQNLSMQTLQVIGRQDRTLKPLTDALLGQSSVPVELEQGVLTDDEAILITYTLPEQGWRTGILLPSSVALKAVSTLTSALYFSLISLIVLFVGVLLFSGHRLLHQIQSTTRQVRNLSQGDIATKLAVTGDDEMAQLCVAVNDYGDHLVDILLRIQNEAEKVKNNAESIHKLSHAATERAGLLMDENHTLATAINEMAATATDVSQNVTSVAHTTEQSAELVDDGFQLIASNADAISQLAEALNNASGVIERLSQDSQQVGSVLDVIMNISEQTNLLALNAAIEAARAGESGRGFAVVADEVRTLASRTQQSATEIEAMISQLQAAAGQGVNVIDGCRQLSEQVTERSEVTRTRFGDIVTAFNDIRDRATSIAAAAEEQAKVTDNIDELAERIRHISDQNAEDAEAFNTVSEESTAQAQRLYAISQQG
ncbi:methyl-accepting chemotaxis protein [Photobacterium sp. SDRW27]|uniref:methyl-accepting chemotaxis protein n=1 Tax=Photobacterium obscurum TaxID=2829490 RepID=UPI002244C1C8|nr:methyl-accepting chemotaxis protein [Photobacterium obscurum]MCW8329565.1 methyl-accepting chemotaxis protein [Photobacterium obscurum]